MKVINYSSEFEVKEEAMTEGCSPCCDALYRINYDDCYDAEYTILRAGKLINEKRYDLLERNCEHFSRWCKTGSAKSSQVRVLWASLGKTTAVIGFRILALLVLALLQYSLEAQEDQVKNRQQLEIVEKWLISIYMVLFTVVYTVYLVIKSGSRLAVDPASIRPHDTENPCSCSEEYAECTRGNKCIRCKRGCCCCCCGCLNLITEAACGVYGSCKQSWNTGCTCYGRTCHSVEMCAASKNCKKIHQNPLFRGLRSFKVIDVYKSKKPITSACYDM